MKDEKFDYFIDQTNKNFDELKRDINDLRRDIFELKSFRMMLIGGSTALSLIATIIFNLAMFWFDKR